MSGAGRTYADDPARATRRVARNAAYLALADGANKLMLFVYNVVAARHLGAAMLGVLSSALALVTMFAVLTDLGLGAVAAREIARDPGRAREQLASALAVKLVASILAVLLIAVTARAIGYTATNLVVVLICSLFVFESAVTSYYCYVFQGFERMELAALTRISQTVVLIAGALWLSRHEAAVERYAVLYVLAGLLSALFAVTVASVTLVRPTLSFDPAKWWKLLRQAAPLGLSVAFTMFYYWNGTTLLSKFCGSEAVGNYTVAFRLVMGMAFVGFAISGAVFPLLSRLFVSDPDRSSRALELAIRFMFVLTFPIAALLIVFASPFVHLLFGAGYSSAASVLRAIAPWGVFACLNSLLSNYFISSDCPSAVLRQTALTLAMNLSLNFLLIPRFGALGAAWSIAVTEAAGSLYLVGVQMRTRSLARWTTVLSPLLRVLAALAVGVITTLRFAEWRAPLGVLAGGAVYVAGLIVTGGIRANDRKLISMLLRARDA